jgi:hypothetical protein
MHTSDMRGGRTRGHRSRHLTPSFFSLRLFPVFSQTTQVEPTGSISSASIIFLYHYIDVVDSFMHLRILDFFLQSHRKIAYLISLAIM